MYTEFYPPTTIKLKNGIFLDLELMNRNGCQTVLLSFGYGKHMHLSILNALFRDIVTKQETVH